MKGARKCRWGMWKRTMASPCIRWNTRVMWRKQLFYCPIFHLAPISWQLLTMGWGGSNVSMVDCRCGYHNNYSNDRTFRGRRAFELAGIMSQSLWLKPSYGLFHCVQRCLYKNIKLWTQQRITDREILYSKRGTKAHQTQSRTSR